MNVNIKPDEKEDKNNLKIFFNHAEPINERISTSIESKSDMVFDFSDVKDNFSEIFTLWLKKSDEIESALELYMTTIQETLYGNIILLLLTQSLESYHRTIHGGYYKSDEEYQEIRSTLMQAFDVPKSEPLYGKMKKTLEHANEYSQRTRFWKILTDVLLPIDQYIEKIIGDKKERRMFADRIADTRNYLTHHDDSSIGNIVKGDELSSYLGKLSNIALACFLLELNFQPDKIIDILERNKIRRNWIYKR